MYPRWTVVSDCRHMAKRHTLMVLYRPHSGSRVTQLLVKGSPNDVFLSLTCNRSCQF